MSVILRAGEITRPVDLARLLARNGQSLHEAHAILQRLAAGERMAIKLEAARLRAELAEFGVSACDRFPGQAADYASLIRPTGTAEV